ncbi:exopolysaccharide production protein YjbE [Erwiniaceae bacterium BAC15a-03b]|uniref:Exopolysaccharide production protein YjbE n=1 Tax=Winslowiella arboricola TaxID=2978220 RepID=A0A9J6PUR8_9GAMM|nr:exopolysaccharide production protein YjbE [Winslowiella arboricola]MCU5775140.1 exopolysaccharide production protein YjbE [Winslowiella arboricola]MCU5780406.1 exopolysaccharide production protein YjbE [Winslowiella arboricola]
MKKLIIPLFLMALTNVSFAAVPVTEGTAAGDDASTTAVGSSSAVGIGAVAALAGVALATAGGSDGSNTGTTTTTSTTR